MDYDDTNHSSEEEVEIPTATSSYSSPSTNPNRPPTLETTKTTTNTATTSAEPNPSSAQLTVHRFNTAHATAYKECQKNHAVSIGGHAVDGCGEFLPSPHDPLSCAACGCHRNFHRKETNGATALTPLNHPQFSPYYRTAPTGYLHHHFIPPQPRPLALPSISGAANVARDDQLHHDEGLNTSGRKRHRTKFTQEQKEKMLEFAERVGWRIQRHDEAVVQQFCDETGLRRHVLKVWMHNNKHTLGKKP